MKKIESLTPEQASRFGEWAKKWIDIGLSTEPANFEAAEKAALTCYDIIGVPRPKTVLHLSSPYAACISPVFFNAALKSSTSQILSQVQSQVTIQVTRQILGQVLGQVLDQVRDQIQSQVQNQVTRQILGQVQSQVWDQVQSQVQSQVRIQVRDQVWSQVLSQVRDRVRDQIQSPIQNQVQSQVWDQVQSQVWDQVQSQVRDQVLGQFQDQVQSQVRDQVLGQFQDQVQSQVRIQVRDQVWRQILGQVQSQILGQVQSQVQSQVRSQVLDQVRDQVRDQIQSPILGQVQSQVQSQVSNQIGKQQVSPENQSQDLNLKNSQYNLYQGAMYASWGSYVSFFRDVCHWENPILEKFALEETMMKNCGWVWWHENLLVIVDRPKEILKDDQGRLHSEKGGAISWRDGYELFFWHGVSIPGEWLSSKPTPAEALGQTNTELRRVACEIVGWDNILSILDAKVIDADGDPEIGTLLRVNLPGSGNEQFLRVQCGTGRLFAIPVPPNMQTAIEAQSWLWGLDVTEFQKPEIRT